MQRSKEQVKLFCGIFGVDPDAEDWEQQIIDKYPTVFNEEGEAQE